MGPSRHAAIIALSIGLGLAAITGCGRRETALVAAPGARDEDAIKYVLSQVACTNPEYVSSVVFSDYGAFRDIPPGHLDFETRDLGDGDTAYVFLPPGGSGTYANSPNFHFVKRHGRLNLIFDGEGRVTEYCEPRINGRYQLVQGWRADLDGDLDDVTWAERTRVWFWERRSYVEAFTETSVLQAKDARRIGTTLIWNQAAKPAYLKAGGLPGNLQPTR